MNRERFEQLTKQMVETCKKEAEERESLLWPYFFTVDDSPEGETAKAINILIELEDLIDVVKKCIEKGEYNIKDIQKIYNYDADDKPFANNDEETEYVAILKGKDNSI